MNNIQKIFLILFLLFFICFFIKFKEPFDPNPIEFLRRIKNHKGKWPSATSGGIGEIRYQSPFYKQLKKY